ncbi:hypothetical protein ASE74_17150 [Pedobacter sp. Leaf216]|nr:hypothetical protein ASE74_17150 [Pedobacter sp. Leaf216]
MRSLCFRSAGACLGYRCKIGTGQPPKGSYFWLGPKVTKTQGLELMSDKFVKAFWSSAQVPPKGAESVCCLNATMEEKVMIKL